jgi:UDP:flavonoid glycosyltransferase YjiC (YdhE family)
MNEAPAKPKRVLLFAEAVTLAHVARPLCFARGLDRSRYRVTIAATTSAARHIAAEGFEHVELDSIPPQAFLDALARGNPLYDAATLERYVDADLSLLERQSPDLVVGDFRLSLSVSARLARVPYVSISSAYWSPYYRPPAWPVPALPLTRLLPIGMAQALFGAARPFAFMAHCGPLNAVRRRRGLKPLPRDLRRIYTDADFVAYSDLPELFPMPARPAEHRFLGPALWEPSAGLPSWWNEVPAGRPAVYLTLGSSGDAALLPIIVGALASLSVTLLVATAGAPLPAGLPPNVCAAPYLPGLQAAARAQLVVCNGGSLTSYQALAGGAPVLGIAGNLDQFLNMQALEAAGVGRAVRADRLDASRLRLAVEAALADGRLRDAAAALRARVEARRFESAAAALVDEILAGAAAGGAKAEAKQ